MARDKTVVGRSNPKRTGVRRGGTSKVVRKAGRSRVKKQRK